MYVRNHEKLLVEREERGEKGGEEGRKREKEKKAAKKEKKAAKKAAKGGKKAKNLPPKKEIAQNQDRLRWCALAAQKPIYHAQTSVNMKYGGPGYGKGQKIPSDGLIE